MSKESYIGGDYIETTGGNNLNFAKGSIINSSLLQVAQTGKENGVTYNLNKSAPKIDGLTNKFSYIIVAGTQDHSSSTARNLLLQNVGEGSKLMFVHQALRRMRLNKGAINFEFLLCKRGYSSKQREAIKNAVENNFGGKYVEVSSATQIINYINTGDKSNSSNISEDRKKKKIQQLLFYSHGVVGEISLGLAPAGFDITEYSFEKEQAEKLNKDAFSFGAHTYLFSCRSGIGNKEIIKSIYIDPKGNKNDPKNRHNIMSSESIAQKIANSSKATVYAFLRRTDYIDTLFTNDELCFSDYMKIRRGNKGINSRRSCDRYSYLLDKTKPLTNHDSDRWSAWSAIESNLQKIDGAWFDPDGARHNVKAAPSPEGVPATMMTFTPK